MSQDALQSIFGALRRLSAEQLRVVDAALHELLLSHEEASTGAAAAAAAATDPAPPPPPPRLTPVPSVFDQYVNRRMALWQRDMEASMAEAKEKPTPRAAPRAVAPKPRPKKTKPAKAAVVPRASPVPKRKRPRPSELWTLDRLTEGW